MSSLGPEALTWTGLLAQWIQFARASLALPEESEGPRWRASVASIINLQAVTFALADLDRLRSEERALALDKGELLIRRSAAELQRIWLPSALPDALEEIVADAQLALQTASAKKSPDQVGRG